MSGIVDSHPQAVVSIPCSSSVQLDETRYNAKSILDAATWMAATEIAAEPTIRQHVRSAFAGKATVSTFPTEDGERNIDPLHK